MWWCVCCTHLFFEDVPCMQNHRRLSSQSMQFNRIAINIIAHTPFAHQIRIEWYFIIQILEIIKWYTITRVYFVHFVGFCHKMIGHICFDWNGHVCECVPFAVRIWNFNYINQNFSVLQINRRCWTVGRGGGGGQLQKEIKMKTDKQFGIFFSLKIEIKFQICWKDKMCSTKIQSNSKQQKKMCDLNWLILFWFLSNVQRNGLKLKLNEVVKACYLFMLFFHHFNFALGSSLL